MLSTGEEVLHGDICDTNAAWLSHRCFDEGFALHRRVTVGDSLDDIAVELIRCSQMSDVVIVNGGLGPTVDDVTTQAMAMAMDVELELNHYWLTRLSARFEEKGQAMPKSNIKQAMLPEGATLIDNRLGTACGFWAQLNACLFFFTPGVPSEFKNMFDEKILPFLQERFSLEQQQIERFFTFGLSESFLEDSFSSLALSAPIKLGYRSEMPFIEIKVFSPKDHPDLPNIKQQIKDLLGDYLVAKDLSLLDGLAKALNQSKQTLAIAERFSGGYIANWLQQTSETKNALLQGWVLNQPMPNCDPSNLIAPVLAMATASRQNAKADIALACGELEQEGVVLGLSTKEGDWAVRIKPRYKLSDEALRCYASTTLLDMLRRYLQGQPVFAPISTLEILDSVFIPNDIHNDE